MRGGIFLGKGNIMHDQEMLRKARKQQQQRNRIAKQHNTTRLKQSFFKEKLAVLSGTRTHPRPSVSRGMLLPTER